MLELIQFLFKQIMNTLYSSDDSAATAITQSSLSSSSSPSEDSGAASPAPTPTYTITTTKRRQRRSRFTTRVGSNRRSTGRATSTKAHDAPMQKKDMYFALDCEMVGVGPEGLESALARVSIINWNNEIVLDTYVTVQEEVTDYRTFVSGIRPEHIQSESAISLNQVRALSMNMLQGKILIGHALENDLKAMEMNHPACDVRDTAKYAPFMRTISKENDEKVLVPKKLKDLVRENFQREIQVIGKSHSPVEDAIAAMDLYKLCRNTWEVQKSQEVNRAAAAHQQQQSISRSPLQKSLVSVLRSRNQYDDNVPTSYTHKHHRNTTTTTTNNSNNSISPNGRTKLSSTRRSRELARAKLVAALYRQRMRWQQKQQQQHQHQQMSCPV
jgi:RNA exonuclease 4